MITNIDIDNPDNPLHMLEIVSPHIYDALHCSFRNTALAYVKKGLNLEGDASLDNVYEALDVLDTNELKGLREQDKEFETDLKATGANIKKLVKQRNAYLKKKEKEDRKKEDEEIKRTNHLERLKHDSRGVSPKNMIRLGFSIVIGYFAVVITIMVFDTNMSVAMSHVLSVTLGSIGSLAGVVVTYFFGGSASGDHAMKQFSSNTSTEADSDDALAKLMSAQSNNLMNVVNSNAQSNSTSTIAAASATTANIGQAAVSSQTNNQSDQDKTSIFDIALEDIENYVEEELSELLPNGIKRRLAKEPDENNRNAHDE